VALGQDHALVGVIQDELPVREDLIELIPVIVERRAMLVVLGSDLIRQTGEGVPEFRALAVTDNLLAHATSIPGSLRMGTPPAPPKRRDAAPAAPDDTQIIPIWIARPAPAPNQDRLQNGGSARGYQTSLA
jgi:hypothetical protein